MALESIRLFRQAAGIFIATSIGYAAPPPRPIEGVIEVKPLESVVHYANARQIPLEGFDVAPDAGTESPIAGDQLTVLFAIIEGDGSVRQWLVEVNAATLTEREAGTKPGTGLGILSVFQSSLKTDTGHEYSFEQLPVALEVHTCGPFTKTGSGNSEPVITHARALATRDYLAHGLAPMAEIELRLRAAGKKNPGISLMFRPKYSKEQIAATKTRVKEADFTEADERAYAEAIYAIVQFGNLGFKTPGLDAITHEIADSPTLFSGAFTNLNWPAMEMEDGKNFGLSETRIFRVPFNFHSKTEAHGFFYVTASKPPLQNVAGILGLTVDGTSKVPGRRLVMRVIAGRRATPHPAK